MYQNGRCWYTEGLPNIGTGGGLTRGGPLKCPAGGKFKVGGNCDALTGDVAIPKLLIMLLFCPIGCGLLLVKRQYAMMSPIAPSSPPSTHKIIHTESSNGLSVGDGKPAGAGSSLSSGDALMLSLCRWYFKWAGTAP